MYKLLIISILTLNTSSKLLFTKLKQNGVEDKESIDIDGNPLWVLNLNDQEWLSPKLRLGTSEEAEDFYYYVLPQFKSSQHSKRVKKDDPALPKKLPNKENGNTTIKSIVDVKKDVWKIINKYALSGGMEPDSYLESYEHTPSIAFYFKGPYTACIVKMGKEEWHYIMSRNSLPSWFNEQHDTHDAPIEIPENIKSKFYNSLLHYLQLLFGHPM